MERKTLWALGEEGLNPRDFENSYGPCYGQAILQVPWGEASPPPTILYIC
jgi:hypothetical protein